MPRRPKQTSLARRLITWSLVGTLVAWGLWQFVMVRRSILADIQQHAPTPVAPATQPETPAADPFAPPETARLDTEAADPTPPAPAEPASPQAVVDQERKTDLLLQSAETSLAAGNVVDGRRDLNAALALLTDSPRGEEVRAQLAALNVPVFLGPDLLVDDPYAPLVQIVGNDSFLRLGRRYHIPPDLLPVLNPQLSPTNLKPGTGIKIVYGPFHLHLVKEAGRLDLYARDMFVRSYAMSLEEGNYLPAGLYRVKSGGKLCVGRGETQQCWIGLEGLDRTTRAQENACLYGSAGLRGRSGAGVKLGDSDLRQLYNVLLEQESLLRIDP